MTIRITKNTRKIALASIIEGIPNFLFFAILFILVYVLCDGIEESKCSYCCPETFVPALIALIPCALIALQIRSSRKAQEAELIFKYDQLADSPEMGEALREMCKLRTRYPEAFLGTRTPYRPHLTDECIIPRECRRKIRAELKKYAKYRRTIKYYFYGIYNMHKKGFISTRVLHRLTDRLNTVAFFKIVERTEFIANENYYKEAYEFLMDMCWRQYVKHEKSDLIYEYERIITRGNGALSSDSSKEGSNETEEKE